MRIPEYDSFIPNNGIIDESTDRGPKYMDGLLSLISKYDSSYGAEVILHASRQLVDLQKALGDNYQWKRGGNIPAWCTAIAESLAEILLPVGPSILHLEGELVHAGTPFAYNKSLMPKRYERRVSFGSHNVCAVDNIVFDPIVGRPMDLLAYQTTTFYESAHSSTLIPARKMAAYLKNPIEYFAKGNS